MMRAAVQCVFLVLVTVTACNDSRRSAKSSSTIDPYVGREVPLEYRKVFNQPKLLELRADGAADAQVRIRWTEAMSRLGTIAQFRADTDILVVTYAASVHDRMCVASEWAKLHDLPALGFQRVRCESGDEAPVPDDGGRAKRMRALERANHALEELEVGLVWHESDGLVVTAIVGQGRCSRGLLAKLVATMKKSGIDLRTERFEKIACSVDPATLSLATTQPTPSP